MARPAPAAECADRQKQSYDNPDLVWVLDRADAAAAWSLAQVPQLLLSGGSPQPITT